MKYLYTIFCVCLSLSLLACDSENESQEGGKQPETPEVPEDSVCEILWDNSHSYFMGLKGSPVEMIEKRIQEEDGEKIEMPYVYSFNEKGNLVKYDPFGVTEQASRWVPVDARISTYQYDDKGRLVVALIKTVGVTEDDLVYTIEYGNHDLYVPLPFAVGTLDFVLQKGVTTIRENGNVLLTCDGVNTAFYTNEESMGFFKLKVEKTYQYDNKKYPVSSVETKTMQTMIISKQTVKYDFDKNGFLLNREILTDMSGEYEMPEGSCWEKKVTTYDKESYMAAQKTTVDYVNTIEGMESENHYELQYWYNDKKLLTGITKKTAGLASGEDAEESYSYSSFDEQGNWVEGHYWLNTDVDETHLTGDFIVQRKFVY